MNPLGKSLSGGLMDIANGMSTVLVTDWQLTIALAMAGSDTCLASLVRDPCWPMTSLAFLSKISVICPRIQCCEAVTL